VPAPLKVLQFCHSYGAPFADVARQYVALFKDSAYEVVTVFLIGSENQQVAELVGGEVIFFGNTSKDVRGMKRKQIKQLQALCCKYSFVLAIAHRFKPIYITSFIKNLPIIGVHHAYGDYRRWSRRWHAYKHKKRLFLLGVSNAICNDLRKSLPKIDQDQIHTLYNRVNVESLVKKLIPKVKARTLLNIPEQVFVFGNVGRLHPDKDQSALLKAYAKVCVKLPETLLVIVGEGRLKQTLQKEAEQLGIEDKVRFMGKVPEVSQYYQAFDCFVLSSDHEPFGMVLLEAMVAGVPVIASHCGGAPEVIGDTGQLFELRNVEQLADKMAQIYNMPLADKQQLARLMLGRVKNCFSDTSVSQAFWALPFIKSVTR